MRLWHQQPARATLAVVFVAFAAGLIACTSRTLPLPPPEVRQVSLPDQDGYVTVQGTAKQGASVGVLNDATQEGTIVTTAETNCGSACEFEARLQAESGDSLRAWQFFETESGTDLVVPSP